MDKQTLPQLLLSLLDTASEGLWFMGDDNVVQFYNSTFYQQFSGLFHFVYLTYLQSSAPLVHTLNANLHVVVPYPKNNNSFYLSKQ
ncbi:hypothetical protein [Vibrio gangliei]|uniref:hypothetical protein n=1 Tax=Vibrio gangliei TaxID=2077090 RepID=UPI0013008BDB|nr:hypothetical protein [Vibrio gangliei]